MNAQDMIDLAVILERHYRRKARRQHLTEWIEERRNETIRAQLKTMRQSYP